MSDSQERDDEYRRRLRGYPLTVMRQRLSVSLNRLVSQREIAEKLGVTGQTIANYESGRIVPPLGRADALAKAYGVTRDEIVKVMMRQARRRPKRGSDKPLPSADARSFRRVEGADSEEPDSAPAA